MYVSVTSDVAVHDTLSTVRHCRYWRIVGILADQTAFSGNVSPHYTGNNTE